MSRMLTAGAELGHPHGDGLVPGGAGVAVVATPVRSGQGAFVVPFVTAHFLQFSWVAVSNRWYYLRAWFQLSALPGAARTLLYTRSGTSALSNVAVGTDGRLTLTNHPATAQPSSPVPVGDWHLLELGLSANGTTTRSIRARLDGVAFDGYDSTTTGALLFDNFGFGSLGSVTPVDSAIAYWDDIAVNDDTGTSDTSYPSAAGKVAALRPVADVAVGNWTLGAGGAGNRWDSVDNTPPLGVSNASATDAKQIRNAVASATRPASDVDLRLEPYSARVAAGHTVKLVQAVGEIAHSVGNTVQADFELGLTSPAETAVGVSLPNNNAGGTYPTQWVRMTGTPNYALVALTDQPVLRLSRRNAITDTLMCCALGAIVEYEPGDAPKFLAVA